MPPSHEEVVAQLNKDLADARSMAMICMGQSSDMGMVIQFLKRSFCSPTYEELCKDMIDQLASLGLTSSVLIETIEGKQFFCLNGESDMVDFEFICRHKDEGRIYQAKSIVLINHELISLLITNFPDDEHRQGQLRDTLAILVDGAEARIRTLNSEYQAVQLRKAKDEFFSLISHELRTPLNPIIGFSTRLLRKLDGKLGDSEITALASIKDNGEKLLTLINDVFDLAKIKNDEINLHYQYFDLYDILSSVVDECEKLAKEKEVDIHLDCNEGTEFCADAERIKDIFENLVSNGVKYSKKGYVKISVEIETSTSGDRMLNALVEDDGLGIAEENHERIFNHFTQLDTSINRKSTGIGIGLYITKRLVEIHEGKIDLKSKLGEGATFIITIPEGSEST